MAFKGSKEYASDACKQTGNTLYDTASSALENITQSLTYGQIISLLMSTLVNILGSSYSRKGSGSRTSSKDGMFIIIFIS